MDASMAPCRVFLVRHGQTLWGREVRFRAPRDVPLNEVGLTESDQAAIGWQFKVPTGSAIEFTVDREQIRLVTPIADAPADPYRDPTVEPLRLRDIG